MQNINSDLIRGNIDTIILKTMEDGDMYGLDIIREVENKSNGTYELKQPTLYSCLKRLENKELISSYWLDSEIGGKRHYYKLTDKGREVIQAKQDEWSKSKLLIDNLLGDFDFNEYRLVKKDDYDKIINGKPIIQYVEVEKQVVVEVPVPSTASLNTNNTNFEALPNKDNQQQNLLEENNDISDEPSITDEFENLRSNNLISFDTNDKNISDAQINESPNNQESQKRDLFDNELIYFKQKQNFQTENQQPSNEIIKNESFKQTSAFDLSLETKKETEKNSTSVNMPNKMVQQDLFSDMLMPYQIEVDNSINEFTNNISMLNKINTMPDSTIINTKNSNLSNAVDETDEEILDNEIVNNNETLNLIDKESNLETKVDHENIHTQLQDDGLLNELNELNLQGYSNKNISFENDDGYDSKNIENVNNSQNNAQINNQTINQQASIPVINQQTSNLDNSQFTISQQPLQKENIPGTNFSYNNEYIDPNYQKLFSVKEDIDEIIFKNVNDYTNENSRDFISNTFEQQFRQNQDDNYKQRINSLSEYAKEPYEDYEEIKYSKDIQSLREEYKNEGIVIKEFNKEDSFKLRKNYLVINKLNLIKSLILLFGYVFVLSAVFIIMDSTELKNMHDFSFKYFLYGFIPFIAYTLFHLVVYLFNPYKKVPAKHSPKIMLIFSSIITIQLLLITYCLNLQMGFYSFTQAGYNHLFWIIPTMISFAPVVSTLIYCGLYHSKNFNI